MFYNELEMLKIRLEELYDVVDAFVLVEATKTHSMGKPKPLYYAENKHLFEQYNDKIIHIVTNFEENYPFAAHITGVSEHWFREIYQRECIVVGLDKLGVTNGDIIMISDADEIPKRDTVVGFRNNSPRIRNPVYALEMTLYYYTIELTTPRKWYHAKVVKYDTLKNFKLLSAIRLSHFSRGMFLECAIQPCHNEIIPDAGFHLSYFGGLNAIKTKVESFAESTDYTSSAKDIEHLRRCHDGGIVHFNGEKLIRIPLAENKNVPIHYL
jgi:hypothetical protein